MAYEEILGSDDYLRRLVDVAVALLENGCDVPGRRVGDFLIIPPGCGIRQMAFVEGT